MWRRRFGSCIRWLCISCHAVTQLGSWRRRRAQCTRWLASPLSHRWLTHVWRHRFGGVGRAPLSLGLTIPPRSWPPFFSGACTCSIPRSCLRRLARGRNIVGDPRVWSIRDESEQLLTLRGISTQACSARGTVSLHVQLSAPMHSYAGFGLAVRMACWTWPPFTLCFPRSVLSSRHCLLVRAAVGSSAQLCRLWACSACGMLDVAAAYSSHASQRSVHSSRHHQLCAQLEAPSACTCSCRL